MNQITLWLAVACLSVAVVFGLEDKRTERSAFWKKSSPSRFWKRSADEDKRAKYFLGKRLENNFIEKHADDDDDFEKRGHIKENGEGVALKEEYLRELLKRAKYFLGKRSMEEKRAKYFLGKREDEQQKRAKYFLGKRNV